MLTRYFPIQEETVKPTDARLVPGPHHAPCTSPQRELTPEAGDVHMKDSEESPSGLRLALRTRGSTRFEDRHWEIF